MGGEGMGRKGRFEYAAPWCSAGVTEESNLLSLGGVEGRKWYQGAKSSSIVDNIHKNNRNVL